MSKAPPRNFDDVCKSCSHCTEKQILHVNFHFVCNVCLLLGLNFAIRYVVALEPSDLGCDGPFQNLQELQKTQENQNFRDQSFLGKKTFEILEQTYLKGLNPPINLFKNPGGVRGEAGAPPRVAGGVWGGRSPLQRTETNLKTCKNIKSLEAKSP